MSRATWVQAKERTIHLVLLICALVSIATTVSIIAVLVVESIPFFRTIPITDFLFGIRWAPLFADSAFGILPLVSGTFMVAGGALLVAIPLGLGAAVYLSEYASDGIRSVAKPLLEVLAGIPTVVLGYFALMVVTPKLLRPLFPSTEVFNVASAAISVGIMIVPTIASLCDDALRAVPRTLRDAAYALSATRVEVATRVVVPAALSGIVAAILLAFARAVGETMIVAIAAGNMPNLTLNPFKSSQTMTAFIAQVAQGDQPAGTIGYQTIFAVGLTLFAITLFINAFAQRVLKKFREVYE